MKIGIDYSPVSVNRAGIGNLVIEVTKALLEIDKQNEYTVFTDSSDIHQQHPNFIHIAKPAGLASGSRWIHEVVQESKRRELDLIISISSLTFPVYSTRILQFVNDLTPLNYPQAFTLKQKLIYRLGLWLTSRLAARIFFISHTTQQQFNRLYPNNIQQDYALLGLNEFVHFSLSEQEINNTKKRLNLPLQYFVSMSTLEPRKNYANMIRAFAKFSEQHPEYYYLIGGKKGWMYEGLFELVQELGVEDKVRFLGYVSDTDKYVLLKNAAGFMYVSHDEGFGLPNIEAYALGCPVLTSDIPIMREVMLDHALYASPQDYSEIADQLEKLISAKQTVDPEFLARFNWQEVARKIISLY